MTPEMNKWLAEYLDGARDSRVQEVLRKHVDAHPEDVAEVLEFIRDAASLHLILDSSRPSLPELVQSSLKFGQAGTAFSSRVVKAVGEDRRGTEGDPVKATDKSGSPRARFESVFRLLATAACLTIVAGVWWFGRAQDEALGLRVAEVRGECSAFIGHSSVGGSGQAAGVTASPSHQVAKAGEGMNAQRPTPKAQRPSGEAGSTLDTRHSPLQVGDMLRPGDGIEVGADGYAKLAYPDTTQVELQQNTRMRVTLGAGKDKEAKRLALDGGTLACSAAPQKMPFEVATRHAVARVVGTRFRLAAADLKTTLAVMEGKVSMCQGEKTIEVSAGQEATATDEGMKMEPVKADAAGLERLSPADSWVRDLLARAEAGPWDTLDFGTGVFAKDDWRVDARGGAADRSVWNMQVVSNEASLFVFDKTHWKRGVIVGRMMLLPDGRQPATPPSPAAATAAAWSTCRIPVPVQTSLADGGYIYIYQGSIYQAPRGERMGRYYDGVLADRDPRGVWHRLALYFDTQAVGSPLFMCASWPDDRADPPPASEWDVKVGLVLFVGDDRSEIRFGIAAKGVLLSVQGLKLVPLGADMPPPPRWEWNVKSER